MSQLPRHSPSIVDSRAIRLARLRQLSRLLDEAIAVPGTNYRIGLDPIIGLIPGGGDMVGLLLSSWIVIEAARLGASQSTLRRMLVNIVLETLMGTVPVVGDVFDVAWKSNTKNIRLLEEHLQTPVVRRTQNRAFLAVFILGIVLAIALIAALSVFILRWLVQNIS